MAETLILHAAPEAAVLLGTTGVPTKTRIDGSNQSRYVLIFSDTEDQSAYFMWSLPSPNLLGELLDDVFIRLNWYAPNVVDGKEVQWMLSYAIQEPGDDIDQGLSSEIAIPATTVVSADEDKELVSEHTFFSVFDTALPIPSDLDEPFRFVVKIRRDTSDSDNMTEPVYLVDSHFQVRHISRTQLDGPVFQPLIVTDGTENLLADLTKGKIIVSDTDTVGANQTINLPGDATAEHDGMTFKIVQDGGSQTIIQVPLGFNLHGDTSPITLAASSGESREFTYVHDLLTYVVR